jgi:hypothetical protein
MSRETLNSGSFGDAQRQFAFLMKWAAQANQEQPQETTVDQRKNATWHGQYIRVTVSFISPVETHDERSIRIDLTNTDASRSELQAFIDTVCKGNPRRLTYTLINLDEPPPQNVPKELVQKRMEKAKKFVASFLEYATEQSNWHGRYVQVLITMRTLGQEKQTKTVDLHSVQSVFSLLTAVKTYLQRKDAPASIQLIYINKKTEEGKQPRLSITFPQELLTGAAQTRTFVPPPQPPILPILMQALAQFAAIAEFDNRRRLLQEVQISVEDSTPPSASEKKRAKRSRVS